MALHGAVKHLRREALPQDYPPQYPDDQGLDSGKDTGKPSLSNRIKELAENSGVQGVPQIRRAGSWFRRLFWLSIVLAGIGRLERWGDKI